ncbi:hypothetical protein L9F63_027850 [Diploptera punctata]|uniref:Uncharacterized protein n=1 Tax=Diploptera punctata TaxID=6984 RepID=A0AAD8A202_DIPPU|nr:hypothetical protein L9F63_027850 [Diploptera punctata]
MLCFVIYTKQEQRSWLKIQCSRGRTARQCHEGLVEAFAETALPYRTVRTHTVNPLSDLYHRWEWEVLFHLP